MASPLTPDMTAFQKDMAAYLMPANPPPLSRIEASHYLPTNPPKKRAAVSYSIADLERDVTASPIAGLIEV